MPLLPRIFDLIFDFDYDLFFVNTTFLQAVKSIIKKLSRCVDYEITLLLRKELKAMLQNLIARYLSKKRRYKLS